MDPLRRPRTALHHKVAALHRRLCASAVERQDLRKARSHHRRAAAHAARASLGLLPAAPPGRQRPIA